MDLRFDSFHSDLRRLLLAFGTDGAALPLPPEESARLALEASESEREFDLALEAVVSQGCRLCPLCGLIVAREGSFTL
jgi:hypothetical protein